MRTSIISAAVSVIVVLLLAVASAPPSAGSLLSFLDHRKESSLADPFRILEQIPFGLEPDAVEAVLPARVDWKETPTAHHIIIDVPGQKPNAMKIEVDDNRILRIVGERKREEEKKVETWHCVERVYGRFWRQFRLPDNADVDSISAKLDTGVLTVTVPKLSPEKVKGPRVVSIVEKVRDKLAGAAETAREKITGEGGKKEEL